MQDVIRTEMHCHACCKPFVAELDAEIDGKHEIECPCGHIHFRVVKHGEITGDRWDSDSTPMDVVKARSVWRSSALRIKTSTVSAHIRERWLNRSDFNGR